MTLPSSYNPNIPAATDVISVSQGQLLLNFQALQAWIDVNHVDYASVNAGKHFFVEFPVQSPVPTTGASEVGLYCQTSAFSGNPELVFSHQSAGGIYEFTSAGLASPGWARLPSGVLYKWGTGSPSGSGNYTVTFPVASTIPVFAATYVAFITPTTAITTYVSSVNTTTLVVNASAAGNFNYLVIGS